MRTLNNLLLKTPRKIKDNAKAVRILNLKVKRNFEKKLNTLVFSAQAGAVTETVLYDITIELYPVEVHAKVFKKPSMDTDAWVKCSCPYFLFNCEYALNRAGSSEIDYSDGKPSHITNPTFTPQLCKHLVKASQLVVSAAQDLTKRDKDYKYV